MLLFVGLAAHAQRGQGGQRGQRGQRLDPEEAAKTQAENFQEQFGLSDEQYKKTYDVLLATNKERNEKLQEMRSSGSFEGMREAIAEFQEKADKQLKEIFNETQWTAYEKWKEERASQRGGRRGGGRGGN
ncbi:hypothetical protein BFP71_13725 [Roseivirga misakiensis]|uniref:DUF4890 domain-containing protein n=2 Tax=Roseivirga misakiensis TaxID=1563681 RepID=A0A1E5SZH6_9BACT|nr:hypothetical protein BFP71_13725 [Roseivirga misakiensis]